MTQGVVLIVEGWPLVDSAGDAVVFADRSEAFAAATELLGPRPSDAPEWRAVKLVKYRPLRTAR